MARKDVINYYLEIQNQYNELLENAKELNEIYAENPESIDEDQVVGAQFQAENVGRTYAVLSYVINLLNDQTRAKGNKDDRIKKLKSDNKLYHELFGKSKEAVLNESANALADIKDILARAKDYEKSKNLMQKVKSEYEQKQRELLNNEQE